MKQGFAELSKALDEDEDVWTLRDGVGGGGSGGSGNGNAGSGAPDALDDDIEDEDAIGLSRLGNSSWPSNIKSEELKNNDNRIVNIIRYFFLLFLIFYFFIFLFFF